ncbi:ribonuclease Z [Fulvitalea axinellae]|uniref:Ribonuclease Z n=1 Tax=Fulvitalea axinellae TaxID=1182444 RepID=A0AAU9CPP1_9BACT|nr:ribonuclease Z [Fulvitalea axinellae]
MSFSVKILGSSSAAPVFNRHHSAQWLTLGERRFLIDCGEGTQTRLQKMNCKAGKISRIFISHLHGDHFFGLIGLISSMHLFRQVGELHIYGPKGLDEILKMQLKYSETLLGFDLRFHPTNPDASEVLFEDSKITVSSFPLQHRIPCTGFVFKEKPKPRRLIKDLLPRNITLQEIALLKNGQNVMKENGEIRLKNDRLTLPPSKSHSYAYCSDTKFDPSIVEHIEGVEMLYHEATFTKEFEDRAKQTFHSTAEQAGKIAQMSGVQKLLIGHFSARNKHLKPLLDEARRVFPETYLAVEGERFVLEE